MTRDACQIIIYKSAEIYNNYAQKENKIRSNEDRLTIIPMEKNNGRYNGINFNIPKDSTEKRRCQLQKVINLIKKIFHSDVNINPKSDEFLILLDEIFDRFEKNNFERNPNQNSQSSQTNYRNTTYSQQNRNPNYQSYQTKRPSYEDEYADLLADLLGQTGYRPTRDPRNPFFTTGEINRMEEKQRQEQQQMRNLDNQILQLSKDSALFFASQISSNTDFKSLQIQKSEVDNFLRLSLNSHDLQNKTYYYNLALQYFEQMKRRYS